MLRISSVKNNSKGVTMLGLVVVIGIGAFAALVAAPTYQNAQAVAIGSAIAINLRTIDEACALAEAEGANLSGRATDLVPDYLAAWPSAPAAGLAVRYPGTTVDTTTAGEFALAQVNSVWWGTYNGHTLEDLAH